MDSVVYHPSSVLRLASLSSPSRCKLGRPSFLLKEIADGPSALASCRGRHQLPTLSITIDGNRTGRPSPITYASGRFQKSDGEKVPQSSDGNLPNSSNQDQIISLFRRIQSSIKEDSTRSKKRSSKSSKEKPSAESVLEVLRQSRKQVKGKTLNERGEKGLARRVGQVKDKDQTDYSPVADFKLTRPPSNFVKRSPIPVARTRLTSEAKGKASSATGGEVDVKKMKLPELKELAKSRGLKGYSKLKKSELIELLRP